MTNSDRVAALSEHLKRAYEALDMTNNPVWAVTWDALEAELLSRLLACGPVDDEERYRCQISIETARKMRRMIEHDGHTVDGLEKELAMMEGRKLRPIA